MTHIRDGDHCQDNTHAIKCSGVSSPDDHFFVKHTQFTYSRGLHYHQAHTHIVSALRLCSEINATNRNPDRARILLSRLVFGSAYYIILIICVVDLIWAVHQPGLLKPSTHSHRSQHVSALHPQATTTPPHHSRCNEDTEHSKTFVIKSLGAPNNNSHRLMRVRHISLRARSWKSQCVARLYL